MKLPAKVREQFRQFGRSGGVARAECLAPSRRRTIARLAAITRWTRARFGVSHFAELRLPGAELIDRGLLDLAAERESDESLLVALAAPRLRREGVPVPDVHWVDPDIRLHRRLELEHGDLAHARYNALRQQVVSFADACAFASSARRAR